LIREYACLINWTNLVGGCQKAEGGRESVCLAWTKYL
jgi:hypothetical protein